MFVTNKEVSKLIIQPVAENERELADRNTEQQAIALLKITMLSKKDIIEGRKNNP
ncbi:hypothetical protein [Photorhabdus temperata]|uniref:hypothetical protein n=1 Tax=Photorhabdus temperata TaxID=574560 RepID=UPI00038A1D3E|nr:hypothetical protein [Photorhabdus temperata]EQC01345.1 hypothetical protein B738_05201 [Photorhabdus temperata subsp. temperata M1021]